MKKEVIKLANASIEILTWTNYYTGTHSEIVKTIPNNSKSRTKTKLNKYERIQPVAL